MSRDAVLVNGRYKSKGPVSKMPASPGGGLGTAENREPDMATGKGSKSRGNPPAVSGKMKPFRLPRPAEGAAASTGNAKSVLDRVR